MDKSIALAVQVPAAPDRVFRILTSTEGQRATWTDDCEVSAGHARFGFPGTPTQLRAEVTTEPDRLVRMQVTEGFPHWERSTWEWVLTPADDGGTDVLFHHSGLDGGYPEIEFARCAQTWARILDRLAPYADDGVPRPVFAAARA
jgi:uncharacterized protein YndB with AHSA1/START domain